MNLVKNTQIIKVNWLQQRQSRLRKIVWIAVNSTVHSISKRNLKKWFLQSFINWTRMENILLLHKHLSVLQFLEIKKVVKNQATVIFSWKGKNLLESAKVFICQHLQYLRRWYIMCIKRKTKLLGLLNLMEEADMNLITESVKSRKRVF